MDYFTVGLLTVVSSKLKSVFESVGAEIEFFPVSVFYQGMKTDEQYFAANPLLAVKAVDFSRSKVEYDEDAEDCFSVHTLIIDESKLHGRRVVIVQEINVLAVQEELAAMIEAAGCVGMVFIDPDSLRY